MIRTGGENRISNFLLWQMHMLNCTTKILWPDFKENFYDAIDNYGKEIEGLEKSHKIETILMFLKIKSYLPLFTLLIV